MKLTLFINEPYVPFNIAVHPIPLPLNVAHVKNITGHVIHRFSLGLFDLTDENFKEVY